MKTNVLLFVSCMLLMLDAKAQKQIDFGVKAGLNVAGLTLSTEGKLVGVTYNVRQGFHLGIYAEARHKKFALQPEFLFSNQGQNFTFNQLGIGFSNAYTQLNYLSLPLMVKYYLTGGLYIQAGPQISLLSGASGYTSTVDNQGNLGRPILGDEKKYIHQYDFSVGFGAGLELPFGVNLSIRYNNGISDVNKYTKSNSLPTNAQGLIVTHSLSTSYARNQVLQITIGYKFKKLKINLVKKATQA